MGELGKFSPTVFGINKWLQHGRITDQKGMGCHLQWIPSRLDVHSVKWTQQWRLCTWENASCWRLSVLRCPRCWFLERSPGNRGGGGGEMGQVGGRGRRAALRSGPRLRSCPRCWTINAHVICASRSITSPAVCGVSAGEGTVGQNETETHSPDKLCSRFVNIYTMHMNQGVKAGDYSSIVCLAIRSINTNPRQQDEL